MVMYLMFCVFNVILSIVLVFCELMCSVILLGVVGSLVLRWCELECVGMKLGVRLYLCRV